MRALYGLAVFVGSAVLLLAVLGMLGGVGWVELVLVIVLAAAITWFWSRRSRSAARER